MLGRHGLNEGSHLELRMRTQVMQKLSKSGRPVFTKKYKAMGDHLQDLGAPKEEQLGHDKDLHKHSLVDKFEKGADPEPHHGHQLQWDLHVHCIVRLHDQGKDNKRFNLLKAIKRS